MGLTNIIRRGWPLAALAVLLTACGTSSSPSTSAGAANSHSSAPAAATTAKAAPAVQQAVPAGYTVIQGGSGDPAIGAKCVEQPSQDNLSPFYILTFVNTSPASAGVMNIQIKFSTGYVDDDWLGEDQHTFQGQPMEGGFGVPPGGQPFVVTGQDTQYSLNTSAGVPTSCAVISYNRGLSGQSSNLPGITYLTC